MKLIVTEIVKYPITFFPAESGVLCVKRTVILKWLVQYSLNIRQN